MVIVTLYLPAFLLVGALETAPATLLALTFVTVVVGVAVGPGSTTGVVTGVAIGSGGIHVGRR